MALNGPHVILTARQSAKISEQWALRLTGIRLSKAEELALRAYPLRGAFATTRTQQRAAKIRRRTCCD